MQTDGLKRHSFVIRYLTLFGGEALSKVLVLAAFAHLARSLGPRDFGIIELALSVTIFFLVGSESGLGTYGARIVHQSPLSAPALVPRIILLRFVLGLPAYAIMLLASERYGMPGTGILALYGLLVLVNPFFTQWVFQGLRQMQWVAVGTMLRYGFFSAFVLLLVGAGSDTRLVAVAEVGGALLLAVFNAVVMRRVLRVRFDARRLLSETARLFKEVWFIGASDLSWVAMWYSPSVILGWMTLSKTEHVAWLAAAVRIVMAIHTFVYLYHYNLMPNLSKEIHEGVDAWRDLVHRSLNISTWAAIFIAMTGTLIAPWLVNVVYGSEYHPAVRAFQIVIWMIPVAWVAGHFRSSLIAAGHQRIEFATSALGGLVTIGMTLLLTPKFEVTGAAAAVLAGGLANVTAGWIAAHYTLGKLRMSVVLAPAVTCLTAIIFVQILKSLAAPSIGVLAGCLGYLLVAARQWNVTRLKLAWAGRLT